MTQPHLDVLTKGLASLSRRQVQFGFESGGVLRPAGMTPQRVMYMPVLVPKHISS